jgi:hypothetical protein
MAIRYEESVRNEPAGVSDGCLLGDRSFDAQKILSREENGKIFHLNRLKQHNCKSSAPKTKPRSFRRLWPPRRRQTKGLGETASVGQRAYLFYLSHSHKAAKFQDPMIESLENAKESKSLRFSHGDSGTCGADRLPWLPGDLHQGKIKI